MVISSLFIFVIFIVIAANQLIPYNYNGFSVLLIYGLVNIYVYYLQYMFTITREEAEKLDGSIFSGQQQHEVLTVGSIDVVDVDLNKYGRDYDYNDEVGQKEMGKLESSGQPIQEKNEYIQEFDLE